MNENEKDGRENELEPDEKNLTASMTFRKL